MPLPYPPHPGVQGGFAHQSAVVQGLFTNPSSLLVLAWLGVGPGAVASYLQAAGQRYVPAAQAQVRCQRGGVVGSGSLPGPTPVLTLCGT